MPEPKKRSSSLDRKVEGYLKPVNHAFIVKYVAQNKCSNSQAVNDAVAALRQQTAAAAKK